MFLTLIAAWSNKYLQEVKCLKRKKRKLEVSKNNKKSSKEISTPSLLLISLTPTILKTIPLLDLLLLIHFKQVEVEMLTKRKLSEEEKRTVEEEEGENEEKDDSFT